MFKPHSGATHLKTRAPESHRLPHISQGTIWLSVEQRFLLEPGTWRYVEPLKKLSGNGTISYLTVKHMKR